MRRISQNGQEPIIDVDTAEDIEAAIRDLKAGGYDVAEISADRLPSGNTSRRSGVVSRGATVVLEPEPRDA